MYILPKKIYHNITYILDIASAVNHNDNYFSGCLGSIKFECNFGCRYFLNGES